MKKTILVVIDGLCSRVIRPAMEEGRLPNLQSLAEAGSVDWDSVSIFPSITPAATSSICTGTYPAEHMISGAHFFDREQNEVHYYGSDFWVVLDRGARNFVNDMLISMNHQRLHAQTLHELIESAGHESASLNYLIYRGNQEHHGTVPWLLRLWPGVRWKAKLQGPSVLCLGDFVRERFVHGKPRKLKACGGPLNRFGFNDRATGELLLQLVSEGLPAFTLAYFPDNDFDSHVRGAAAAVENVEKVDAVLGELIDAAGGLGKFLKEIAIIVTGDHGHDDIDKDKVEATIDLSRQLKNFSLGSLGSAWGDSDDLMICPNLRAAQVYVRKSALPRWDELVEQLLQHEGVDQVTWQEELRDGESARYRVATGDRGTLEFTLHKQHDETHTRDWDSADDDYGQTWCVRGNLQTIDARVEGTRLQYGDYPNALERIAMSFQPQVSGDLWISARPGREFYCPGTVVHAGGGSHGSLHACDSISPIITAGLPHGISPPIRPRLVDIAPLVLQVLGIESPLRTGRGHALSAASRLQGAAM